MGRWLHSLPPVLAGLIPALVCAGAIGAAGTTALGVASAGAATALTGAFAFHQLARWKLADAGRKLEATTGRKSGIEGGRR